MNGFFTKSELALTKSPLPLIAQCGLCKLKLTCKSPVMPVSGRGKKKILIIGEAPGCITGDSLIEVAFRNKTNKPKGVPISDLVGKKGFYVYSFDIVSQKMKLGEVVKVWNTGRKKVYNVTYEWKYFDSRTKEITYLTNSIRVTSNHPFLIKRPIYKDPFKGIYCSKDYLSIDEGLSVGHSLQPFHRSFRKDRYFIGPSSTQMIQESRFLISEILGRKLENYEDVHHKNKIPLDDRWINLEVLTKSQHSRLHALVDNPMNTEKGIINHRKALLKQSYRRKQSENMKRHLSDSVEYRKRVDQIRKQAARTSTTVSEKYKDPEYYYKYLLGRKKCFNVTSEWVERKFKAKFPECDYPPVDNHKIISIEYVGVEDVYDMEVKKYHNFAVNGIFVHNSEEDRQNRAFVGKEGQKLAEVLRRAKIELRRDCWITNSLLCRPPGDEITNDKWVDYCRPNLIQTVKQLKPSTIILLGGRAVESLLKWIWKEDSGGILRWAGFQIPNIQLNAWICPTFHPSFVMREENPVLDRLFEEHLEAAASLEGRPWGADKPDYKKLVKRLYTGKEAAQHIDWFTNNAKAAAFDYETTTLKPDGDKAKIVCCSISDGTNTIAFPWLKEAREAMGRFLQSPVKKISANARFETRWSLKEFGFMVENWAWDTVLSAHILDNRPHISGLKFQAFALLGVDSWDDNIQKFLKAEKQGGNSENRIREVSLDHLLWYCGIDSLLEYKLAKLQRQQVMEN